MTPAELRALFPACANHVYLNAAGVAPTSLPVRDAVTRWIGDLVGHGVYHEEAWEALSEKVRAQTARLVGAEAREIAFVRNTSHGLGLVAEGLDWRAGDEVAVATEVEYPSNVYPWQHLASRGVSVRSIRAVDGGVVPDAVAEALGPRTRLVAVSAVQYASGHRTDLHALGALCRERGVLLCVDGIQQVGALPLDVRGAGIHFLTADSHKWMLGLPGIGFLFVDSAVLPRLRPSLVGWKSTTEAWNFDAPRFTLREDAAKLEEGTPAYAMLAGLGAAVDLLLGFGVARVATHVQAWLADAERELATLGCTVGPVPADRAGILTVAPPGDAAAAAAACEAAGVRVSLRRGRLRVAPHAYSDAADLAALLRVLAAQR
jgi:selenocysteine lyase/cysteine desulfurase